MDSISTLAIETSCDDTSVGIVRFDGQTFRADTLLAYSQIQEHQRFGGVVPELAYRLHSEKIIGILEAIGKPALEAVDCISVTTHPGLPGSLLVGKTVGNMLA
jgi:N6-L-threonylcarbamoyladenine synthase